MTGDGNSWKKEEHVEVNFVIISAHLPTCPYLTVLVRKSAGSTVVHAYFSKYGQRDSKTMEIVM